MEAEATLTACHWLAADYRLLTFDVHLPLLPCQHVLVSPLKEDNGAGQSMVDQWRPYTPVEVSGSRVVLLVKTQSAISEPLGPGQPTNSFSQWLAGLKQGQAVRMQGPHGAVALDLAAQNVSLRWRTGKRLYVRQLALVAGGSGITCALQILHAACIRAEKMEDGRRLPLDLKIWVLLSDKTPEHTLLPDTLPALRRRQPDLIVDCHHTFTAIPHATSGVDGDGASRHVDAAMLRECLPPPAPDTAALIAGPPSFEAAVQHGLRGIGHMHTLRLSSGECLTEMNTSNVVWMILGFCPHAVWPALRCCLGEAVEVGKQGCTLAAEANPAQRLAEHAQTLATLSA